MVNTTHQVINKMSKRQIQQQVTTKITLCAVWFDQGTKNIASREDTTRFTQKHLENRHPFWIQYLFTYICEKQLTYQQKCSLKVSLKETNSENSQPLPKPSDQLLREGQTVLYIQSRIWLTMTNSHCVTRASAWATPVFESRRKSTWNTSVRPAGARNIKLTAMYKTCNIIQATETVPREKGTFTLTRWTNCITKEKKGKGGNQATEENEQVRQSEVNEVKNQWG